MTTLLDKITKTIEDTYALEAVYQEIDDGVFDHHLNEEFTREHIVDFITNAITAQSTLMVALQCLVDNEDGLDVDGDEYQAKLAEAEAQYSICQTKMESSFMLLHSMREPLATN